MLIAALFSSADEVPYQTTRFKAIRPLPCHSQSNPNKDGVCMFNYQCLQARGTPIGTCLDSIYVGSCCRLPQQPQNGKIPQAIVSNGQSDGDHKQVIMTSSSTMASWSKPSTSTWTAAPITIREPPSTLTPLAATSTSEVPEVPEVDTVTLVGDKESETTLANWETAVRKKERSRLKSKC